MAGVRVATQDHSPRSATVGEFDDLESPMASEYRWLASREAKTGMASSAVD